MSTRACIGIIKTNNTVITTYLHNDGYPEHAGKVLSTSYKDNNKVNQLLKLGKYGISTLGYDIGKKHNFNDTGDKVCTFYGRDRGEFRDNLEKWSNLKDCISNFDQNYLYLFVEKTKKWLAFDGYGRPIDLQEGKQVKTKRQLLEDKLRPIIRKLIKEETVRLKPHPVVGDDTTLDLNNLNGMQNSNWKTKPGSIYTWTDSEGEYPAVKVKCLGADGRMCYFEVLEGKYKHTYIVVDSLIYGKEIS